MPTHANHVLVNELPASIDFPCDVCLRYEVANGKHNHCLQSYSTSGDDQLPDRSKLAKCHQATVAFDS